MNTAAQQLATGNRRRFRFGLRTLLVVVTLAAVASWGYWVGWPWWQIYREQMSIEYAAKHIKPGMTIDDANGILFASTDRLRTMHEQTTCEGEDCHAAVHFATSKAVYILYSALQRGTSNGWNPAFKTVEFFRLPPVPINYKAQTKRGRSMEGPTSSPQVVTSDILINAYIVDFYEYLSGDRKTNPGFRYELIYSDPPATSEGK